MMKNLAIIATCLISFSLVSCNNEAYEDMVSNTDNEPSVFKKTNDSIFVTSEEALEKANAFLGRNSNKGKSANIEPVIENGQTMFYVINYPEGGFAVISATKDYYPVLAYSEENNMDLSVDNDGIKEWVKDTKESVRGCHTKHDSVKVQMRNLWIDKSNRKNGFVRPTAATRGYSYSSGQVACWNRLDEYAMKYGDGWYFAPLSDPSVREIFEKVGCSYEYENLLYSANFNHSSPECSVIGWKNEVKRYERPALLSTHWSQKSPFNNLCGGYPAGCAAIAVAQVLRYHVLNNNGAPYSFSINGISGNMSQVPDYASSNPNSKQDVFVRFVGGLIDTHYSSNGSWATPGSVEDGLKKLGYSVSVKKHNSDDVSSSIANGNPVIMLGNATNLELFPGSLAYIGYSHYWIADGYQKRIENELQYFTEWQPYDRGNFVQGWGSKNNPNTCGGQYYHYLHMNWGHGGKNDGWFGADSANEPDNKDYKYSRKNFYISIKK